LIQQNKERIKKEVFYIDFYCDYFLNPIILKFKKPKVMKKVILLSVASLMVCGLLSAQTATTTPAANPAKKEIKAEKKEIKATKAEEKATKQQVKAEKKQVKAEKAEVKATKAEAKAAK
jgi:septal ring factor EnvC (AmiA/AmiB activator)